MKDSSAARNGLLTDHQICEINGQNVIGLKVILSLSLYFPFLFLCLSLWSYPNLNLPDESFAYILTAFICGFACMVNSQIQFMNVGEF